MIQTSLANSATYGARGSSALQQLRSSTSRALSAARNGGGGSITAEARPSAGAPEMPEVHMKSIRETRFYQRDVQEHFLLSSDALMKSIAYTKAQAKSATQYSPEKAAAKRRQMNQARSTLEASGETGAKSAKSRRRMGDITVQEAKDSWAIGEKVDTYV